MSDEEGLEKHILLDGRDTEALSPVQETFGGGGGGNGNGGDELPAAPVGPVKQFYRDLMLVLTEPRHFFETRYPETSFTYALSFGIIVTWIASFLSWLTRIIRHETLFDGLSKMREKLQELPFWKNVPDNFWAQNVPEPSHFMPAWLIELFGIILSPFQALISLTMYGLIIFLGAYILVPKNNDGGRDPVELKNTIKIVSFCSAPLLIGAILGFLPIGLGNLAASLYYLVLMIFALSIRFRVSGPRAFGVVILPGIVSFVAIGCLIGVFAALFFGIIASLFGSMS